MGFESVKPFLANSDTALPKVQPWRSASSRAAANTSSSILSVVRIVTLYRQPVRWRRPPAPLVPVVVVVCVGGVGVVLLVFALLRVFLVPGAFKRREDEADVRERLREVAERQTAAGIDHLREEAEVVRICQELRENALRLGSPADVVEHLHEPEAT